MSVKFLTKLMGMILVVLLVATSCAPKATPTPSAAVPEVIKIGVYLPMTGAMAGGGQMEWEGIQLAHDLKPKVLGKDVQLILVDNKSDKVEAATAVTRLIEAEKVVAILGSYGSSLSMAGGEVAEKAGIPVLGTSPTNPLVTQGKKWYFRTCFIDPFQGYVVAKYAVEQLKAKTAAILMDVRQDYSVGISTYFRDAFIKLTGNPESVLTIVSYHTGDQDFTAQLTTIMNLKPDVVFAPAYMADAGLIWRQAKDLGLYPKTPILGADAMDAPEFIQIAGDAAEGACYSTHYHTEAFAGPASKKFVEEYRKKYNKEPNAMSALGYDTYNLMLDAIERAGSANPAAIRDALEATKGFEGATGTITMDENHNAKKPAVILCVEGGKPIYKATVQPD